MLRNDDLKILATNRDGRRQFLDNPPDEGAENEQMDTDTDQETPQCGICLLTLRQGLLSKTMCGHVLHSSCLRTWYAGTSLKCPVCNSTQRIELQDVACTTCRDSVQGLVGYSGRGAEAHLVRSMKCGHVHRSNC